MNSVAPALLAHCRQVYQAMVDKSRTEDGNLLFEGSGTRIVQQCGLSNPYYTKIMKALKQMDCVRQARRGGGGTGSIWYLLQEPTEELFREHCMGDDEKNGPRDRRIDNTELLAAVRAVNERLTKAEQRLMVLEARNA